MPFIGIAINILQDEINDGTGSAPAAVVFTMYQIFFG